jgi:small subunit ribosomal protein S6
MPLYDLMLLLDPTAPGDRHEAILRDVKALIDSGGKIAAEQDWGQRRMAFEIDHRPEAEYHLIQFEAEKGGELLERLDHTLKITDGVMRHRIIKLKDGTPPPPMPRPEGRREEHAEAPAAGGNGAAAAAAPAPEGQPAAAPLPPEEAEPAAAPAIAGSAAAGIPAAPSDLPAPAPAETPPPPDVDADQEAGPAGGGGDDEAPSGPAAA